MYNVAAPMQFDILKKNNEEKTSELTVTLASVSVGKTKVSGVSVEGRKRYGTITKFSCT